MLSLEADGQLKLIMQEAKRFDATPRVPAANLFKIYKLEVNETHEIVGVVTPTHPDVVYHRQGGVFAQPTPDVELQLFPHENYARGRVVVLDHRNQVQHVVLSCFHEEGALFGCAGAMSQDGSWMVVGAQGVPAHRVEGCVVLLRKLDNQFIVQRILRSPQPFKGGLFGAKIAMAEPYFVVAAPFEEHWQNANQQGYVYLYHWDATTSTLTCLSQFAALNSARIFGLDLSLAHRPNEPDLWELLVLTTPQNFALQKLEVARWTMKLRGTNKPVLVEKGVLFEVA